jgi:hypothetical protein
LPHFGTGVQIQYIDDDENLAFAPLFLFEITDGRPSMYWVSKFYEDGSFNMQPPSFYNEFYHDDLSEGIPEVYEDYCKVRGLIESERCEGTQEE